MRSKGKSFDVMAELLNTDHDHRPEIILLQETNLNKSNINDLKLPEGWYAASNADPKGYMKGTAILVWKDLMPDSRELPIILDWSDNEMDILAIEAKGTIFVTVYMHVGSACESRLHQKLLSKLLDIPGLDDFEQQVVIAGDFNYPHLHASLCEHMDVLKMTQVCDGSNTFISNHGSESKLDWIFSRLVPATNFRIDTRDIDHHILRVKLHLIHEEEEKGTRLNYNKWREMKQEERDAFHQDLETATKTSQNIDVFYGKLQEIAMKHLGPKASTKPKILKEYLHQSVRQARKTYKKRLCQFRRDGSDVNRSLMKEAKKDLRYKLRCQYRKSNRRMGHAVDSGFADIIKVFIQKREPGHHQRRLLENPEEMVAFWRHVFHDDDALQQYVHDLISQEEAPNDEDRPRTMKFTADEIELAIKKLKNKSPADDDLRLPLLKNCSQETLQHLARLFNILGASMRVPLWMKSGIGRVIYKKGPRSDPSNYRIILLAPLLGKLYDKLLELKMRAHPFMKTCEAQYGFLENRRPEDAVFIANCIRDGQKRKKGYMILAFMDLKKAFDEVNHKKLLQVLRNQGAPEDFLNLLEPMLTCRKMELCGESIHIMKGTPQGCPISPILFVYFINPLLKRLQEECQGLPFSDNLFYTCLAFADDLTLIPADNRELAKMLKICQEWANEYGMSFNISKSKIMICEGKASPDDVLDLPMDLETVDEYKYLGVMLYGKPRHGGNPRNIQILNEARMWAATTRIKHALRSDYSLPLRKQVEMIKTFILSQAMYPAPVCVLDYKSIDIFINRQLRQVTGMKEYDCSMTFLRNELGVISSRFEAYKRALNFLWHLLNKTSFKDELNSMTGPEPYERLIKIAEEIGLDVNEARALTKGKWRSKVKKAVLTEAQAYMTEEADERKLPPPQDQCKAQPYVRLGGGVAKHGLRYRWSLWKDAYLQWRNEEKKIANSDYSSSDEESDPADSSSSEDEDADAIEICSNCKKKHSQASTAINELIHCFKACDNKSLLRTRKRTLRALGEEMTKKPYKRIPKLSLEVFPSLQWKHQTRETTKKVLILLYKLRREAETNAENRQRGCRITMVTNDVLHSLPKPKPK